MFNFFQSIFSGSSAAASTKYDAALIERAVERVIEGTDPRLRALSAYHRKLAPAVERAIDYAVEIADALPPPVELSGEKFGKDDRIRGLFVSKEHLREVLGKSQVLRDYLDGVKGVKPERIYALLGAERSERNMLGMDMQGDIVRRDVIQLVVSFSNHLLVCPSGSQPETSLEAKRRVFDNLIEYALQQILANRHRQEASTRQYSILKSKLRAMEAAGLGMDAIAGRDQPGRVDPRDLQEQIAKLETELESTDFSPPTLEHNMEVIIQTLSSPETCMQIAPISLRLNHMGIKLEEDAAGAVINLRLDELSLYNGRRRVVLPVWIPSEEIPERRDFLKEAGRYL